MIKPFPNLCLDLDFVHFHCLKLQDLFWVLNQPSTPLQTLFLYAINLLVGQLSYVEPPKTWGVFSPKLRN